MTSSAEQLEGMTLDGGWEVVDRLEQSDDATGGHFSVGYLVRLDDGREGYLKALDYEQAFRRGVDPARELQRLTEMFNFERDVLAKCSDRRMDRVVLALDDGTVEVEDGAGPDVVQYIIFELADGDVRTNLDTGEEYELTWTFRTLHHTATGLRQLHQAEIAHQDVKPSNVLVFEDDEARKLADLGRAAYQGHQPPHHDNQIAGDLTYAPPELLYGHIVPDWNQRRLGCDAYLLGSMAVFFFTGQGTTSLMMTELGENHHWRKWRGSYEEVLPYIREAFGSIIELLEDGISSELAEDFIPVVRYLCEPNPSLRGHPRYRRSRTNQYNLEWFVSRFNTMANRARFGRYN